MSPFLNASYCSIGKIACGAFADNGFASAGKRRDFCRLRGGSHC
jgi:hypothetical protein